MTLFGTTECPRLLDAGQMWQRDVSAIAYLKDDVRSAVRRIHNEHAIRSPVR